MRDRSRTALSFEVAELIGNFVAEEVDGKWRVRDRKAATYVVADYADESMARSGARLAASFEIVDLLLGEAKS